MRIGIIGLGMVGGTLQYGFARVGHEILPFDLKMPGTKLADVLPAELVFLCVPTPATNDGECDTYLVEKAVEALARARYAGVVVIKSTVTPGTTDRLHQRFPGLNLAFCPEFLREKSRYSDFVENHDVCVFGVYREDHGYAIQQAHQGLAKGFAVTTPLEAEFVKYFANTFNALRIVFANQFHDVCAQAGADYQAVKNAVTRISWIGNRYLDSSKEFRAFGGNCLPKDTRAFASFVAGLDVDAPLFKFIVDENNKIKAGT